MPKQPFSFCCPLSVSLYPSLAQNPGVQRTTLWEKHSSCSGQWLTSLAIATAPTRATVKLHPRKESINLPYASLNQKLPQKVHHEGT